jgi:hypothetical protein
MQKKKSTNSATKKSTRAFAQVKDEAGCNEIIFI